MSSAESKQPEQNPHFAIANQAMAHYIGALELAKTMQAEALAAEDRARGAEIQASELEELSKIDVLTGLYNDKKLEEDYSGLQRRGAMLSGQRSRATDTAESVGKPEEHSVLMLDLDHFKEVNDTGGHAKGDRVLKRFSDIMKRTVRSSDLPVRLHGEEFAVLLPRTSSEQAVKVAETLRGRVEKAGDVTVSIGVSGLDLLRSLEDNLVNADTALYAAKESGRNQVVRYEELARQS